MYTDYHHGTIISKILSEVTIPMKISKSLIRSYRIGSLLCLSLLSVHAYAAAPLSEKQEKTEANKQMLLAQKDKLSSDLFKRIDAFIKLIECTFGDLATLIQEDAVKTKNKKAKKELLRAIIETRKALTEISLELHNNPTKNQFHTTFGLANQVVKHLKDNLNKGFTDFKAFDLASSRKRVKPIAQNVTDENLASMLTRAEKDFKSVQQQAENTGLYWYNKLYRNTFDRFVVRPCDKYNLHWKGVYLTAALAGAAYLWYKMNRSTNGLTPELKGTPDNIITHSYEENDHSFKGYMSRIHDTINYYIRDLMGWEPQQKDTVRAQHLQSILQAQINGLKDAAKQLQEEGLFDRAHEILNDAISLERTVHEFHPPVKLFGKIEKALIDAKVGYWAIGGLIYEPLRQKITETYEDYSDKLKNKLLGVHNWLKGGAFYQRHKNKKKTLGRIEPRYTFDSLIGLDHAKEVLSNIVKYIQDPESYDRVGLTPAMGYLLYGPPRTGKSMISEALAGEIQKIMGSSDKFPFFVIEARWIAKEGNFNIVMQLVKEHAPCVIFIDEIDMLNLHRDKFKDKNVLLSEFLATISGCMNSDPDKHVIILAATNKRENLDPSLQKRLSVHIPFEYPSFMNRAEFFIRTLEGKGLPVEHFDIKKLANQTEGSSFELLHDVINNAQFITRQEGRPITQADIERSLDTELHNIIYHNYKDLSDKDQHTLAIHMAGHAIAYSLVESDGIKLSQVTIRPIGTTNHKDNVSLAELKDTTLPNIVYGHVFTHHERDSLKFITQKEIERLCMIELAGHVAERLLLGSHCIAENTCSNYDTTKAFYWARKHQLNGLDERIIEKSIAMQDEINRKAHAFMQSCEEKMTALLEPHLDHITLVAEFLKKFEILGTEDMEFIAGMYAMKGDRTIEEFIKDLAQQVAAEEAAADSEIAEDTQAPDSDDEYIEEEEEFMEEELQPEEEQLLAEDEETFDDAVSEPDADEEYNEYVADDAYEQDDFQEESRPEDEQAAYDLDDSYVEAIS